MTNKTANETRTVLVKENEDHQRTLKKSVQSQNWVWHSHLHCLKVHSLTSDAERSIEIELIVEVSSDFRFACAAW